MSKSSTLLKIMSIIFIIFGVITLIVGILAVAGGALFGALGVLLVLAAILPIISGILYLLCGVFGVRGKNLSTCFVMAIIILVAQVISFITTIVAGAPNFLGIIGIVLTILYLVGVKQSQTA